MGGQALTSSELAGLARVSRATASEHLSKLTQARLLTVTQKRRNRYYRITSPLVAKMLESIKAVTALETPPRYQPRSAQDDVLRFARTCYDHLAGRLGVAIADALVRKKYVVLSDEGGELTVAGKRFLTSFGSALMPAPGSRRTSADPAWIGASGAITSRAMSAQRYAAVVSNAAGSCVSEGHALFASPPPAGAACAKSSAWKCPTCAGDRALLDVRFGSLADISHCNRYVRFTSKSGHVRCNSACPLCANSGHSEKTKLRD
jgi:hypothetical protein